MQEPTQDQIKQWVEKFIRALEEQGAPFDDLRDVNEGIILLYDGFNAEKVAAFMLKSES